MIVVKTETKNPVIISILLINKLSILTDKKELVTVIKKENMGAAKRKIVLTNCPSPDGLPYKSGETGGKLFSDKRIKRTVNAFRAKEV